MNIAIISPNKNIYSETFIQAHKKLNGNIFFYYGGAIPSYLEGVGYIGPSNCIGNRIKRFIGKKLFILKLSDQENAFAKSLKKNNIDVVLAEYGTTGAKLVNTCRQLDIPLTTIFHGFDASKEQILTSFKNEYKKLFDRAESIIAVSRQIKRKLIELGCLDKKIFLTPCAPDDKFLAIEPAFKEPKSFVAIGRFINKKAPYYTIMAFQQVTKKHPNAILYFAGEGELLECCKNIAAYFKLEKNIFFLGKITPEKYIALLSTVQGFIQHSITANDGDAEGTPVAVLEASAAGIPVISTFHAGISDVILHEETGLLVEEHDVDGMAQNIIKLIEDPQLARELGAKGKQRIKEHFTMKKHLRTIEKAIGITEVDAEKVIL